MLIAVVAEHTFEPYEYKHFKLTKSFGLAYHQVESKVVTPLLKV